MCSAFGQQCFCPEKRKSSYVSSMTSHVPAPWVIFASLSNSSLGRVTPASRAPSVSLSACTQVTYLHEETRSFPNRCQHKSRSGAAILLQGRLTCRIARVDNVHKLWRCCARQLILKPVQIRKPGVWIAWPVCYGLPAPTPGMHNTEQHPLRNDFICQQHKPC